MRERTDLIKVMLNEGLDGLIYLVRKDGAIKLGSRSDATILQNKAKEQGYNFEVKKQGWDWLVVDADI